VFLQRFPFAGRKNMCRFKNFLAGLGAGLLLAGVAGAQSTNAPATLIENFENQTNTIIVKGFSQVGKVSVDDATLAVRLKETRDISHNQKLGGITVVYNADGGPPGNSAFRCALVVDEDELDSLAGGMEYLAKINYDVTPLAGFDASYTTRSGLRFSVHSERRQGGLQMFLQFGDSAKMPLTSEHWNQLRNLIVQAKASLDAIK
jgi:hypothetical protein